MLFGCKNPNVLDMIGQYFACHEDFARCNEYESWLFDAAAPTTPWAKTSITSLCGRRSVLEWQGRKHQPIITLESELSDDAQGGVNARYDLRCRMRAQADSELDWHGSSTIRLAHGMPFLTDALKLPDGRTIRQGQRASVNWARGE